MSLHIPYRTRQRLKRAGIVLLILAVVALLVWGCWMLWLQRYVIYTREEGARLDFELNPTVASGELAVEPAAPNIQIHYNEGDDAVVTNRDMVQLQGYYIKVADLANMDQLKEQIKALPKGTAVMVEVKSIKGYFYYSTALSENKSSLVDPLKMDEFMKFLDESGMYTIAYMPALRDYFFGLHHVPDGLPTAGGYLWMDEDGCYWLNPASQGTISYLVSIIEELKARGFDEVVLSDFYFPTTSSIVYKNDKPEALAAAAKTLVATCSTDRFVVSFVGQTEFAFPEGRSRMYRVDTPASQIDEVVEKANLSDVETKLVFLTELHDTRFDTYSVLRPIADAS